MDSADFFVQGDSPLFSAYATPAEYNESYHRADDAGDWLPAAPSAALVAKWSEFMSGMSVNSPPTAYDSDSLDGADDNDDTSLYSVRDLEDADFEFSTAEALPTYESVVAKTMTLFSVGKPKVIDVSPTASIRSPHHPRSLSLSTSPPGFDPHESRTHSRSSSYQSTRDSAAGDIPDTPMSPISTPSQSSLHSPIEATHNIHAKSMTPKLQNVNSIQGPTSKCDQVTSCSEHQFPIFPPTYSLDQIKVRPSSQPSLVARRKKSLASVWLKR